MVEEVTLHLNFRPLVTARKRPPASDDRPPLGKICIDLEIGLLIKWHFFARVNGVDGTRGYAHHAVDAFVRVYHKHVHAIAKGIDRAHLHAIGVLAQDAGFSDDMGHVWVTARSLGQAGQASFDDASDSHLATVKARK